MIKIVVEKDCTGCGICAKKCPTEVLEVIDKVSTPVKLEECMACRLCEAVCPENGIKVYEI